MTSIALIPSEQLKQIISENDRLKKGYEKLLGYLRLACPTIIKSIKHALAHEVNNILEHSSYESLIYDSSIDIITKYVNDFSYMFSDSESLKNVEGLSHWDVSNGTNFKCMFSDCISLESLEPLSNWDVSKGTNFSGMINNCGSLTSIEPLSKWDVSNGTDFSIMFAWCDSLESIKPLSNWNVSKGTNFSGIFIECDSITDITPLSNWCIPEGYNVKDMFTDNHGQFPKNISQGQIDWLNKNIKRHD